jgi:P27 family predicted phage terminase small subunit
MIDRLPSAPRHLSRAARDLFTSISRRFVMEPHDLAVLTKALEAWDRAEQARTRIDADGLMVTSRLGEQKPHPLLGIERDSRTAFLAGMRQLNLDYEPIAHHEQTAAARAARWRNSA